MTQVQVNIDNYTHSSCVGGGNSWNKPLQRKKKTGGCKQNNQIIICDKNTKCVCGSVNVGVFFGISIFSAAHTHPITNQHWLSCQSIVKTETYSKKMAINKC